MQVLHKKTTLCHWQSLYWLFSVLHTQPGKPQCKAAKCSRPQKRKNMILGPNLAPDLQGKTLNKLWILIAGSSTQVFPDSFFTCLLLAKSIFSSQKMDDNQTHFQCCPLDALSPVMHIVACIMDTEIGQVSQDVNDRAQSV